MRKVYVVEDCMITPLGNTSAENYRNVKGGITGVKELESSPLSSTRIAAAKINNHYQTDFTFFEQLSIDCLERILAATALPPDRTLFLLSTTKGNIELLEKDNSNHPRISLPATAKFLASRFGFSNYHTVSNACISGVLAIITAKRFIEAGLYDHALIVGTDVLSKFIVSGFQSLQALSPGVCKPFDIARNGINLGEACGAMIISAFPEDLGGTKQIQINGEGCGNDANHISGPSRTGNELAYCIHKALHSASMHKDQIDFISAHGTATLYNDEMEAKAFALAGMLHTPLNSLKSYFGHTLGAAGVIESIMAVHALKNNEMMGTLGYETLGVSEAVNVCAVTQSAYLRTMLKTASGFGGCNAAIIFQKQFD